MHPTWHPIARKWSRSPQDANLKLIVQKAEILDDEFLGLMVNYELVPVVETVKIYRPLGRSLLNGAIRSGRDSLVTLLLSIIGKLENHRIWKLANLAIEAGNLGILKSILKYCPDINLTDEYGRTFLRRAICFAHHPYLVYSKPRPTRTEFMLFLLESGSNINMTDQQGATAFHYAAIHGNLSAVDLLIKEGAEIDKRDINGSTALHRAAKHGVEEMVEFLIEKGADIEALDDMERTPENLAVLAGQREAAWIFTRRKLTACQYDGNKESRRFGPDEYQSWFPEEPEFI